MNNENKILIDDEHDKIVTQNQEFQKTIKELYTKIFSNNLALDEFHRENLFREVRERIHTGLQYFDKGEIQKFHAALDGVISLTKSNFRIPLNPWESIMEEVNRGKGIPLPNKFGPFMEKIFMRPGEPVIIGGYAGEGKSSVQLNLVRDAIINKRKCVLFTLEMEVGKLWLRLMAIDCFLNNNESKTTYDLEDEIKNGRADFYKEMTSQFSEYLHVINAEGWTASEIISAYENYVNVHGEADQVFIDYIQIINPERNSEVRDRRSQIIETVSLLTAATKRHGNIWILAAQLNRGTKNSNEASDSTGFQESARIEQDAGLAITLARPLDSEKKPKALLEVRISKNRNGRCGRSFINFDGRSGALNGEESVKG